MEQLQAILKEKTTGTLTGMKKKYGRIITFLLAGIFLNILVHPFLHFLLGDEGPVFRVTFGGLLSLLTLIVFCLIVVFFYWIKYTAMRTAVPDGDLKLALVERIASLHKSLKQEICFILLLFAALFIIARLTSQYLGHGDFLDIFRKDILLAMAAGFGMMGFYLYKRIKFYKGNTRELQKYLEEFKEGGPHR